MLKAEMFRQSFKCIISRDSGKLFIAASEIYYFQRFREIVYSFDSSPHHGAKIVCIVPSNDLVSTDIVPSEMKLTKNKVICAIGNLARGVSLLAERGGNQLQT
uniref:Uncharacterized protein n=1 Tax=Cacopsylla melanoneura TaxID=428564 RepID=A0A8D8VLH9_9HEMI